MSFFSGPIVCLNSEAGLHHCLKRDGRPFDFVELKEGFLSDSLRESPPKIDIVDRLEAGVNALPRIKLYWTGRIGNS